MTNRKWMMTVCGAAALTLATAAGSDALMAPVTADYLTFDREVALPGRVLPAGAYAFDLMRSDSGTDMVRVSTPNRTRIVFLGFTVRVERPRGAPKNAVTFREAPRGQPVPIAAWYPIRASDGYEFIY